MKLKKLASVLLAAVMAVSLATTAFAEDGGEDEQTGNITVTAKSSGRQLAAYRLFDSRTNGENYGYELNNTYREQLCEALSVNNDSEKTDAQIGGELLEKLDGIETDSAEAKTFALSMQNALKDSDADVTLTEGTTENGKTSYTATDVPLGYYIIFDKAEGSAEYAPTFAMLNPANTNVQVDAKDSTIGATKGLKTDENDEYKNTGNVNIGDTVTYRITGDIPAYASTNNEQYEVKLTDTLPDNGQLQYVEIKSVELSGDGINKTFTEDNVVFKDKAGNTTTDMTKAVSFVFDKLLVDKANGIDDLNDESATITITYTAKVVDADAIVNENTNTYKYEYGNPTGGTQLTSLPEKQATVYTYGFKIFKYTGDNTPLAGAEFSLKKGNTELKFTKTGDNYVYDPVNGSATLVSGDDGYVSILGLDAGEYTLEETKAPDGYNLLANTLDVTITPKSKDDIENADCTVSYKLTGADGDATNAGNYTINVENTTGTQLPGTGGMGTTLFTAGGLLILCAAGAFLYFNRKRLFGR
jgi:fimbrial isopeptide formation D2 family protein/LPXTG-motif cell wall-anchored protein